MTNTRLILAAAGLLCLTNSQPLSTRSIGEWFNNGVPNGAHNIYDGMGAGQDSYTLYTGDGSTWPSINSWVSFDDMFNANKALIRQSCANIGNGNGQGVTEAEIGQLWNAIQSASYRSQVDHRFILAIILQESKGCVRVKTTANGLSNPGLMQDHAGQFSCNVNGVPQYPCPDYQIFGMVYEGTSGTAAGDGLAGLLNQAGGNDAKTYYTAARLYNSGSYTSGNLDDGRGSTDCYASDVANRLTGWVWANSACNLN